MPEPSIRCLVVDDERLARELIANHLQQLERFELVASCASAIEAATILEQQPIDLLFLDIEMPVLRGTDFYQNLSHKPPVIFTTAYRDYALDGFELEAVDYLLKPITFARFFKAIERFKKNHVHNLEVEVSKSNVVAEDTSKDHLFIRVDRKAVKLVFDDIRYVQGLKDYVEIHTEQGSWVTKTTMKSLLKTLPTDFIQVHKSYIINLNHVSAYTAQDVELGDAEVPIGEHFQQQLLDQLQSS